MTTHLSIEQVNDLVDERSGTGAVGAVHVQDCEACAGRVAALRAMVNAALALPREMEPPAELWIDIRAEIDGRTRATIRPPDRPVGSRPGVLLLAAAAVLLVVLTALTTAHMVKARVQASPALAQGVTLPVPQGRATPTSLTTIDRSYQPTLAELTAALAANRDKLAPATVARVERNLRIIDDAIVEVRDALAHDPNNAALAQILGANYRQKIELLRRVSEWVPTS